MAKRKSKNPDTGGGESEGVSLFTVLVVAIVFAAVLLALPLILAAGERALFKTNHVNHLLNRVGLTPAFAQVYKPVNEAVRPQAPSSAKAARQESVHDRAPSVVRRPSTLDNKRAGQ